MGIEKTSRTKREEKDVMESKDQVISGLRSWNRQGSYLRPGNGFFPEDAVRVSIKEALGIKGNVPDNAKPFRLLEGLKLPDDVVGILRFVFGDPRFDLINANGISEKLEKFVFVVIKFILAIGKNKFERMLYLGSFWRFANA